MIGTSPVQQVVTGKASAVMELESSIQFEMKEIAENKKKIKASKKEIDTRLMSDSEFFEITKTIKEKQKEKKQIKQAVYKKDEKINTVDTEVQKLRADNKMRQLNLSDLLVKYEKKTGQRSVPDAQGTLFEFETYAKLVSSYGRNST